MDSKPATPNRNEMRIKATSCHGTFECLGWSSAPWRMSPAVRVYQKVASYLRWCLENLGWRGTCRHILATGFRRGSNGTGRPLLMTDSVEGTDRAETLGLRPGELVEVKAIDEILATLNQKRRCKGLLWMNGMRKYCGKRFRVYRRVERIMLESNGELRNMKNTVLLEGAMCDGTAFGGCDRSCFHFWREAWLKRVPEGESARHGDVL